MRSQKVKNIGKALIFTALGLFVLWFVFLCLRYAVFQHSVSLADGLADLFEDIGSVFGDLHFFDDKFTILWKAAGWLIAWFTVGFGVLLIIDGIFQKRPFLFIATVVLVLGAFTSIAFIAMSGDFFYYIAKFSGKNVFYTLALIGFICLSWLIFVLAVAGAVLLSEKDNEEPVPEENEEDKLVGLSYEELSELSRNDHQAIVKTLDNQDNALCLVVLGSISIVVAGLFFILSFRRKMNKPAGIDTLSLQFWIFVICAVGGAILLTLGLVRVVQNLKLRIAYKKEIAAIAKLKDQMADKK